MSYDIQSGKLIDPGVIRMLLTVPADDPFTKKHLKTLKKICVKPYPTKKENIPHYYYTGYYNTETQTICIFILGSINEVSKKIRLTGTAFLPEQFVKVFAKTLYHELAHHCFGAKISHNSSKFKKRVNSWLKTAEERGLFSLNPNLMPFYQLCLTNAMRNFGPDRSLKIRHLRHFKNFAEIRKAYR